MSTGARGEGILIVGDEEHREEHRILFTNRALAEAEKRTGKTMVALAQGATEGELGIGDMAILLQTGLNAARREAMGGARPLPPNTAFNLLDRAGFAQVATVVLEAVGAVLAYDPNEEEEEGGAEEDSPPA